MTPVQLPEVPAREVVAHHIHGTEAEVLAFRLDMHNLLPGDLIGQSVHVLTADQLRAYATEAVMAERARLMLRVDAWRYEAKLMEQSTYEGALDYRDALTNCADDIAPLLATQPEQNSGR